MTKNSVHASIQILLLLCTLATIFKCSTINNNNETTSARRQLREEQPITELINEGNNLGYVYSKKDGDKVRPHIHTFFNYIDDPKVRGDNNLLDIWKKSWYEAGWYPVVLTLEDAQRHPLYREFEHAFKSAKYPLSEYNQMCYYRWLAMAVAGGGWSSDMDMLPLNLPAEAGLSLPNEGRFTGHVEHVPSLLSGSKDEWERMCTLLLKAYQLSNASMVIFSDMMAMLEIREKSNDQAFICDNLGNNKKVIELDHVYNGLHRLKPYEGRVTPPFVFDKPKCDYLADKKAIHFSHDSVAFVHFVRLNAFRWVQSWREQCVYHNA